MTFRPAFLIGIYNHGDTIADVVAPLSALSLPCRIVDDGSDSITRRKLEELPLLFPGVRVERLSRNSGRGAALMHGFKVLAEEGFTHVIVLDADGQHDPNQATDFLEAAKRHPEALILGQPIFDARAPKSRLYGRRISQFWVNVETLSFAIKDPLCGYRCYPLRATTELLRVVAPGRRMDFDPEIAVRLAWAGTPIVNIPTRVLYPPGGISHFHMVRDNARISWMHTRLFFGMLLRLPALLSSKPVRSIEASA